MWLAWFDWNIRVSSNSSRSVTFPFGIIPLTKAYTLLFHQIWVIWYHYYFSTRIALALKTHEVWYAIKQTDEAKQLWVRLNLGVTAVKKSTPQKSIPEASPPEVVRSLTKDTLASQNIIMLKANFATCTLLNIVMKNDNF